MILFAHILFGAGIGSLFSQNPLLAGILALLGHYFLDVFPHVEYSIDNLSSKNWKYLLTDLLKVCLDFCLALIAIFFFSKNLPIIYFCAFIAIIPDAFTVISSVFPHRILSLHDKIHTGKIHYLTKQKKFPMFWRITTQIIAIVASIMMLQI